MVQEHKFIAIVGMAGSGKTGAALYFRKKGFTYIRFGQVVIDEVIRRGFKVNEKNERKVAVALRKKYGMGAMAKLNLSKIKKALKRNHVIVDGLYSWKEYEILKKEFGDDLIVLAIYASPKTRYQRLLGRKVERTKDRQVFYRSYSVKLAEQRDYAELEKQDKGGPIAMADYTIINEDNKKEFEKNLETFWQKLKKD